MEKFIEVAQQSIAEFRLNAEECHKKADWHDARSSEQRGEAAEWLQLAQQYQRAIDIVARKEPTPNAQPAPRHYG